MCGLSPQKNKAPIEFPSMGAPLFKLEMPTPANPVRKAVKPMFRGGVHDNIITM